MKSLLVLKASKDICGIEVGLISHHCKLLKMNVTTKDVHSTDQMLELIEELSLKNETFDYIYLCTHGSKDGFLANMGGTENYISWTIFSQIICENTILNDDTILLLACCKGGLFQVASDIMAVCHKINYVCGVRWSVHPWDLTTGFVVFIHNIEIKKAEPTYAAQKASNATDYTFTCHERDEIEMNPQYEKRKNYLYYELGWADENGNWIEQDPKIKKNAGIEQ